MMKVTRKPNALVYLMTLVTALLGLIHLTQAQQNQQQVSQKNLKTLTGDIIIKPVPKVPEVPLFFNANINHNVSIDGKLVTQSAVVSIAKLQGESKTISLLLSAKPTNLAVADTGNNLKEWALRKVGKKHYLDVIVKDPSFKKLNLTVTNTEKWQRGVMSIVTFGSDLNTGNAGFSEKVTLSVTPDLSLNVSTADGFSQMKHSVNQQVVLLSNKSTKLKVVASKSYTGDVDLRNISLKAGLDEDGKSALISLKGNLNVRKVSDQKFLLLKGDVALTKLPVVDGIKVLASRVNREIVYELSPDRVGEFPVDLVFAVKVKEMVGWNSLGFTLPNGAVVPITLEGFEKSVSFNQEEQTATLLSELASQTGLWKGVVPATGVCLIQWKNKRKVGDGELFYTSEGRSDVRIGAGLMEIEEHLSFKVLQGKMESVTFDLTGEGEVLSIVGNHIASSKVDEVAGQRVLTCIFTSARSEISDIRVKSQSPIGVFPAKIKPLTITPRGAKRHSGYVKITNKGAVRIETSNTDGLVQLAPNQYPASPAERKIMARARQLFVYRYPSGDRALEIAADQINPEVAVSHISVYELGETDRVIHSDIEIDIREAGLREWSFLIPDSYLVSSLECAQMADHVVSTVAENGQRMLKVIFKQEVIGRLLVQVKLEKNEASAAGTWKLPKLTFTGAIAIRGEIGVQAEHGWRVTAGAIKGLTDRALAYFPKRNDKLQQAYRTREGDWSAEFTVSAMGQSVQADLFHLYHLKESILEAKILVNYFVIGAPASKWELLLPSTAENISVEGQNVRSWEVENNMMIVHLHQPALGAATLLITYEEGMQANGGAVQLGEVAPMGVQSESGFIHLVSNNQVQHQQLDGSQGLHSISPLEMPSSFQVLSAQPSVAAWQYSGRPYTLKLDIKTPELVETIDQVVGAATLDTKITSSGEVVTNGRFLVNTRGKKALRVTLPEGNKLWSAKSDNILINARVDGDQFILPLPPTDDPNRYRIVEIRYGGVSENPEKIVVGPPVLSAPMTVAEWKVRGDNHLIVTGGNVRPLQEVSQRVGFDVVRNNIQVVIAILLFLLGGLFISMKDIKNKWVKFFGVIWVTTAMVLSFSFAFQSIDFDVKSLQEFDVVAPVVGDQETVLLELKNTVGGVSTLSSLGLMFMVIGFLLLISGQLKKLPAPKLAQVVGIFLLCVGALYHVGGGLYFYFMLGLIALVILVTSLKKIEWSQWKVNRTAGKTKSAVSVSILIACMGLLGTSQEVKADELIADSIEEEWNIIENKVKASMKIKWVAKKNDSITILSAPATLTNHQGSGFRIVKWQQPNTGVWMWKLVAESDGLLNANINYTMLLKNIADKPWLVPSGKSVVKFLKVEIDQENWEVSSPQSIRSNSAKTLANTSKSEMSLLGVMPARLNIRPKPRDRGKEKLRFFAETADIYLPAAGVLDGRHLLKIRPLSGQVDELMITIPSGLLVGDVISSQLDSWRFDAEKQTLTLTMQSPQSEAFNLMIVTQKGMKAFPQNLAIEPIKVLGADNVVGMLGYGFGAESQPDNDKVVGLLEVNIADFDQNLLAEAMKVQPSFVLHKAYRYGNDAGRVDLRVAAVAPEIRVESEQVIRLTDERLSMQINSLVNITRTGVFELKFKVPEGLTVESISGNALRDWTESVVNGEQVATLFLNGKTIGQQRFSITMQGDSSDHVKASTSANTGVNWVVPQWKLENVKRQKGILTIVPDHGIRLRVVNRENISQMNSKGLKSTSKNSLQFKILQRDWELGLGVQKLDAWITAQLLQEVTLKESITKKRVSLQYNVENSVVKSFRVNLPNVSSDQAQTVRASGPDVKEIVHLEGSVWEIQMKQAVIGNVAIVIAYEDSVTRKGELESIHPVQLIGVEQATHYLVVRAPGRLDIQANGEARELGWRVFDWSGVPKNLHNISDRGVPSLCYRVNDKSKPLAVSVKRHAMAGTLKLRVEKGEMKTLLSSDGSSLSRLALDVRVIEESSLSVTLPKGSELFNVVVNEESVAVVRNGDEYRFIVAESANETSASSVKVTYRIQGSEKSSKVKLLGPSLSIPLEKMNWYVLLPDGYDFNIHRHGGFDYKELLNLGKQNYVENYVKNVRTRYARLRQQGQDELQQAMTWSSQGKLDKANSAFNRVFQNAAVDAASNEDARVKLERNMTSQAIMGLNTRRQQMYLDNKKAGNPVLSNGELEKAASENPFFLGQQDFDPNQLSNYMLGNTQEEINAMSRIAKKLVGNQMNAPQTMQAINVDLLDTDKVLHFYRDIQLAGEGLPEIELGLTEGLRKDSGSNGVIVLVLLGAAIGGGLMILRS